MCCHHRRRHCYHRLCSLLYHLHFEILLNFIGGSENSLYHIIRIVILLMNAIVISLKQMMESTHSSLPSATSLLSTSSSQLHSSQQSVTLPRQPAANQWSCMTQNCPSIGNCQSANHCSIYYSSWFKAILDCGHITHKPYPRIL